MEMKHLTPESSTIFQGLVTLLINTSHIFFLLNYPSLDNLKEFTFDAPILYLLQNLMVYENEETAVTPAGPT